MGDARNKSEATVNGIVKNPLQIRPGLTELRAVRDCCRIRLRGESVPFGRTSHVEKGRKDTECSQFSLRKIGLSVCKVY